jgi:hypothetical protein
MEKSTPVCGDHKFQIGKFIEENMPDAAVE